ncbi:MAG: Lrp/AsnC family transcriptional regulator [Clostridia bacterium]
MQGFDAVDLRLISLLQKNARCPVKQLAAQVFMSPPAVTARLMRLEKAGAITGYQPMMNLQMLGYGVVAFVSLGLVPGDKQRFSQEIAKAPNVMECHHVTGDYSMFIKACFRTTKELDAFVGELQQYGRTHTQIVFSTVTEARTPELAT